MINEKKGTQFSVYQLRKKNRSGGEYPLEKKVNIAAAPWDKYKKKKKKKKKRGKRLRKKKEKSPFEIAGGTHKKR